MDVLLEASHITKDFPGVRALDDVSFVLRKGQIHVLCGENGAGKSTLINVLSGVYPFGSYEGQLFACGREVAFRRVADATEHGIAVIHQELSLFNELSVMENIFVGHELKKNLLLDKNAMYLEARKWLEKLRLQDVPPETRLGNLGVGKQQLVEIARVLRLSNIEVLILDEPTAALTDSETEILLDILQDLKKSGMGIIYISHKLDEVMKIADYITVFRDGKSVAGAAASQLTQAELVRMMVGREISEMYPQHGFATDEVVLEVWDYNVSEHFTEKELVKDASFELHKGEILGIFGLIGAGRTELVSSLYGSNQFRRSGKVFMEGREVTINSPQDAINNGIMYCTEDRKGAGLIPTMDVRQNMTIAQIGMFQKRLAVDQAGETLAVKEKVLSLNIKTPSLSSMISTLSGGNQQKVLLGRMIIGETKVLILDEPTRGIDIGAKQEIYSIMSRLAGEGVSIIMVSSELPEILGVSDRVIVMHQGHINGELDNIESRLTEEHVMIKATGYKGEMQ